jgi:hypothetical protein
MAGADPVLGLRFRVPIRDLFANLLINRVRAGGVEFELVPVVEALQASVEERREEVAKAEDPAERERAADKLQRDAAALGRVEAVQERFAAPDSVSAYVDRVRSFADAALIGELGPTAREDWAALVAREARWEFERDAAKGIPVNETFARLGPPNAFAEGWLARRKAHLDDVGRSVGGLY